MKSLRFALPVLSVVVLATCAVVAQEKFFFDPFDARPLEPEVAKPIYRVDPDRQPDVEPPVEFAPFILDVQIAEDVRFERAIDAGLDDLNVLLDGLEDYEIDVTGWEKYANENTRLDSWTRNITSIDVVDGDIEITVIGVPVFIQECRVCISAAYTTEVFRLRNGKLKKIKHIPPREGAGWVEV